MGRIHGNLWGLIGNTPLLELHRIRAKRGLHARGLASAFAEPCAGQPAPGWVGRPDVGP